MPRLASTMFQVQIKTVKENTSPTSSFDPFKEQKVCIAPEIYFKAGMGNTHIWRLHPLPQTSCYFSPLKIHFLKNGKALLQCLVATEFLN